MTKTYEAYAEVFGQQELALALYGLPAEYKAEIGITGFDISHIASLIADAAVAANIYSQMGFTGEYYTVDYKGKKYVIFKGFGSMRRALKGTIYLAKDPRVIKLGIGPFGARSALKFSAILTLVLYATDVVVQGLAGDFPTLGKLTNGLFQAGADFALSSVASAIIGAAIGIVTTAVFPAALGGIIAGAAVSYLFNSEVRERTVTRNFLKLLRSDSGGAASATYSCSDLGASALGCTLLGSGADYDPLEDFDDPSPDFNFPDAWDEPTDVDWALVEAGWGFQEDEGRGGDEGEPIDQDVDYILFDIVDPVTQEPLGPTESEELREEEKFYPDDGPS